MYYNIGRSDTLSHVSVGKFYVMSKVCNCACGSHFVLLNVDIRRGNDSSTIIIHRSTPIRLSSSVFELSTPILFTTLMAHSFIVAGESINIAEWV